MGYTELIRQRLQTMPKDKQAEVYDFVEFVASRSATAGAVDETRRKTEVLAALNRAREAWPKMSASQIERLAPHLRAEWDGRGWESPR